MKIVRRILQIWKTKGKGLVSPVPYFRRASEYDTYETFLGLSSLYTESTALLITLLPNTIPNQNVPNKARITAKTSLKNFTNSIISITPFIKEVANIALPLRLPLAALCETVCSQKNENPLWGSRFANKQIWFNF